MYKNVSISNMYKNVSISNGIFFYIIDKWNSHIVQSLNLYTTKLTETFYACYMSVMCLAMPIYV